MLIDTHSHTNFKDFEKDYKDVIAHALANDTWIINASSNLENSQKAIEIAKKYKEGVYAAISHHPIHVGEEGVDFEEFLNLAKHPKVVAVGETGLDWARDYKKHADEQKDAFKKFIAIALEVDKPIIIHCRDAYHDLLEILSAQKKENPKLRGVFHFFSGSADNLKTVLEAGFYVSFTGVITFTSEYDGLVKMIPEDRIMSETDCPWVAPVPHRGKRNEPMYVRYVVEKMAQIRGVSFEKMAEIIFGNAKILFKI